MEDLVKKFLSENPSHVQQGVKNVVKTKKVELAYDAEDVYDALKNLMAIDDGRTRGGLFKIMPSDEDSDTMFVAYIAYDDYKELTGEAIWYLTHDEWLLYANDYVICAALLKFYSRL